MVLSGYICLLDRMEQSNVSYNFIFIFYGQAKVSIALLCTGQYRVTGLRHKNFGTNFEKFH